MISHKQCHLTVIAMEMWGNLTSSISFQDSVKKLTKIQP